MRRILHLAAGLLIVAEMSSISAVAAIAGDECAAPPGCAQPTGCQGSYACPTCKAPCQPTQGAPPPGQSPMGFFQSPPPMGAVVGPSVVSGVEGDETTFPERWLILPSINLHAHFRTRTNAHSVTEGGVAPYVQPQGVSMGVSLHPTFQGAPPPTQGAPPPTQGAPPPCDRPVPCQGAPP